MSQTANYAHLATRPMMATHRKLRWIEEEHFHGWRCSECEWVLKTPGPPVGRSLKEMLENYELLRDREFAAHVCAEHPRSKNIMV